MTLLHQDAMTRNGVTLKYAPASDGCKPTEDYHLCAYKDGTMIDTIALHEREWWLFGRDDQVVDYVLEHASISKQQAVIQFRRRIVPQGAQYLETIKAYLLDLESTNGTLLNGHLIEAGRYYELKSGDLIQFSLSTREYLFIKPE